MDINTALTRVVEQQSLTTDEMRDVMQQIMTGQCGDAQIGGFLVALRMKGETIDEITGAVQVMRELASGVQVNVSPMVDIVGTGGDGANLFNVSTASSFVVAASGAFVAKHGNRSVSSSSGSADVLEAAGVRLDLNPQQVAQCIEKVGVGFMFAPGHHSAMKHAIGPRKELGLRTIFNMLGPLTNPAGVKRQVIGVFSKELCLPFAQVLQRLGSEHILVVHAEEGLDELSLAGKSYVAELKGGEISEYEVTAAELGLTQQSLDGLSVTTATESLTLIKDALGKRNTAEGKKAADMIALNAGAAIYVSGVSSSLQEGVKLAEDLIHSGQAIEKLNELARISEFMKETEQA